LSPNDRGARRLMVGALVVVLAVTVGVLGGWAYLSSRVPTHTVPNLVGMNRTDALADIVDYDWKVEEVNDRQDGTEVGDVLETRPAAGVELREGETITLVVSEGATLVDVPTGLVGMTEDDAMAALQAAGLEAEVVPQVSEDFDEGTVIGFVDGQEPPAQLPRGSAVGLVVSAGDEVDVPDVEGMTVEQAMEELDALGLEVAVDQDEDDDHEAGEVIRTDPEAGDEVEAGDTVTIIVASGGEVDVPDVRGMSFRDATEALEDEGLTVGIVTGGRRGTVAGTIPTEGQEVPEGTPVNLFLSPS
jgi:eukaryotic-like serine/threonine-protein kinase